MENGGLSEVISDYISSLERMKELLLKTGDIMPNKKDITVEDQKRAAYALNMCTVSVSQIIDYDDINILEQEYEAILNNLNLEQIPKDDALLHILKQLLDTITYFRIEEGDKQLLEKEYQQKMKNAIWTAAPNFGLLLAGGSPLTMAVSLASQVGIGYMNYRRNKAEYDLEHGRQLWQLQRTAIEQFNGLRRELFDTAWRLADTYNFPDEYRLTEKQIKQYNKILMDQDEIRKYERLESIKDKFEAYPPFWYFIGNVANFIAGNQKIQISNVTRKEYRQKAMRYFEKYEEINELSILREDSLAAACALEHIDLLMLESEPDINKVNQLLHIAVEMSGNSCDILEICAITYLRMGEKRNAEKILKMLVNEDYNSVINAQMLSAIYVKERNRSDYELLSARVGGDYLYPMPKEDNQDIKFLESEFGRKQKMILKQKYKIVLENLVNKYAIEWNKITSNFELGNNYPEEFFFDSPSARTKRENKARQLFLQKEKKEIYQEQMVNVNYELNILRILNELYDVIFHFRCFENLELHEKVQEEIEGKINVFKNDINEIQKSMDDGKFALSEYLYMQQKITLWVIVGSAISMLVDYACVQVEKSNVNDIVYMENDLRDTCLRYGIKEPEVFWGNLKEGRGVAEDNKEVFIPELFGHKAVAAKKNAIFMADMTSFVKRKMDGINISDEKAIIYFSDEPEFDGYFYSATFDGYSSIKMHAFMVIKDSTKRRIDLIFTTDGIVDITKDKVGFLTPYKEVRLKGDAIVLYSDLIKKEYRNPSIDIHALYNLMRELGNKFIDSIEEKIEYIDGCVTSTLLNAWFKERKNAMQDDVTRIYALPKKEILSHMGYHIETELDLEKHLMQFYYDSKTGDLLEMRIIRYDNIESNFQARLLEHDGFLKVGK